MNRWLTYLLTIMVAISVLTGCSTGQTQETTSSTEETVTEEVAVSVVLSKNNGEEVLNEKELVVEKDTTLMELMKANFEVEETDGFINSIEGIAGNQEEKMAWMFSINGEPAMVGAAEYVVEEGDEIVFDYHSWE